MSLRAISSAAAGNRLGNEYERFAEVHAETICRAVGVDADGLRFRANVELEGRQNRHQIDVLGESDEQLVVIECKNRKRFPRPDASDAAMSVVDIAKAFPGRRVTSITMTSTSPPKDVRSIFENGAGLLNFPNNLSIPLILILVPPEVIEGHIIVQRFVGSQVVLSVVSQRRGRTVEELEFEMSFPDFRRRLAASLEVLAWHRESALALPATGEAAACLLHLGNGSRALELAMEAARLGAIRLGEKADDHRLLRDMASFRIQLTEGSRRVHRPGVAIVNRLRKDLSTMTPTRNAAAQLFIGAWAGLYDDPRIARLFIENSKSNADNLSGGEAPYARFLARLRLAELSDAEERGGRLAEARRLMSDLGVIHRAVADDLCRRVELGEDASIASTFSSSQSQAAGPARVG